MSPIGIIIKELRQNKNMSRTELAEGICTEKYIYLIEKGERTPSSELLILLGRRLGEDLLAQFKFSNCDDPVTISKMQYELSQCILSQDYIQGLEITKEAEQYPDNAKVPWKHMLKANRILCQMQKDKDYEKAISEVQQAFLTMEKRFVVGFCGLFYRLIQLYAYHQLGRTEEFEETLRTMFALINLRYSFHDTTPSHP